MWKYGLAVLAFVVGLPLTASAQSAIAGLVNDQPGAALPGVIVEADEPGAD